MLVYHSLSLPGPFNICLFKNRSQDNISIRAWNQSILRVSYMYSIHPYSNKFLWKVEFGIFHALARLQDVCSRLFWRLYSVYMDKITPFIKPWNLPSQSMQFCLQNQIRNLCGLHWKPLLFYFHMPKHYFPTFSCMKEHLWSWKMFILRYVWKPH